MLRYSFKHEQLTNILLLMRLTSDVMFIKGETINHLPDQRQVYKKGLYLSRLILRTARVSISDTEVRHE